MRKTCTKCAEEKDISLFSKSKTHAGGYSTWCKACHKQRRSETQSKYYAKNAEWKRKNKERVAEYGRAYRQLDDQKEKAAKRTKRWVKANPSHASALWASMKSARKAATPFWADFNIINFLYATRLYMQQDTQTDWHVDHVVPIKGKRVSGLHVHFNLRVVPARFNLQKSNKFLIGESGCWARAVRE